MRLFPSVSLSNHPTTGSILETLISSSQGISHTVLHRRGLPLLASRNDHLPRKAGGHPANGGDVGSWELIQKGDRNETEIHFVDLKPHFDACLNVPWRTCEATQKHPQIIKVSLFPTT